MKYIERNALDVFIGVTTQQLIKQLLERCIPGNPSTGWNADVSFDPKVKSKKQVQQIKQQFAEVHKDKSKHPTWDPSYDYVPSNIAIYLETYKQQVVQVLPDHTLAQVFEGIVKSTPEEVEGAHLENGAIILNVFRVGSKAEKLWKEGKGRKGFALTQPSKSSDGDLDASSVYAYIHAYQNTERPTSKRCCPQGSFVHSCSMHLAIICTIYRLPHEAKC